MAIEKVKQKAEDKAKEKLKQEFIKAAKRLGFNFVISELPEVGNFWPAFTIFWWQECKNNLTAPDGLLMFPLAVTTDIAMIVLGLFDWGDFGITGMVVRFFGWVFFYGWRLIRGGGLTGGVGSKENEKQGEIEENSPDTLKTPEKKPGNVPQKPALPTKKAA